MDADTIVELNVGGTIFTTTLALLTREKDSLLCEWFRPTKDSNSAKDTNRLLPQDANGRSFIDRDGVLFGYILDSLRHMGKEALPRLVLPDGFQEYDRLKNELEYYRLDRLAAVLAARNTGAGGRRRMSSLVPSAAAASIVGGGTSGSQTAGFITLGYHGSFSFGRQGQPSSDVAFRRLTRLLVCGRVALLREAFGETINDGRDPDHSAEEGRYTSRYFLKHTFLELAFDQLGAAGFRLVGCCATGANGMPTEGQGGGPPNAKHKTANVASEEDRWAHYSQYVFCRP